MDDVELAWVAGLLEGEGCFDARHGSRRIRADGTASTKRYPRVHCYMTDEDVLQRLHRAVGHGSLNGPYVRNPAHKPAWSWLVMGKRAEELMVRLRPLMGNRRGAKIDEILEQHGTL